MKRTKVKNIARQIRGVSYKPENLHDSLDDNAVILLRANNIDDGKINFDDVVYVDKSKVSDDQYLLPGDILICASSGSKQLVGKAASVTFDKACTFGAFCKVVRPNLGLEKYLGTYFQSSVYRREISAVAIGANINNIRNEHIDALELPLYSNDIIQSIVTRIDLLQRIIDKRKTELEKFEELIKARFVEMFGKGIMAGIPLKECCISVQGGGTPSMKHPEYYGGDVPFIKSGDVRGDTVSSGALWLTEKALIETTAKYVPKGAVLVVNRSAALLREFRAAIAGQPVVINQDIKAFIPKDEFTSEYLLWAIKIQTQFLLTKVTTVLTSHIDLKDLLELQIVPAPIEQQNEFSRFIAQVDKSKVIGRALDFKPTLLLHLAA